MTERIAEDRALAYLELLGVEVERGDVDASALAALQRAHVTRIPYENIDIRGCVHTTVTPTGNESHDVDSEYDWWGIVIDGFGLAYADLPREERARVWDNVRGAHEAWESAGRP